MRTPLIAAPNYIIFYPYEQSEWIDDTSIVITGHHSKLHSTASLKQSYTEK